MRQRKHAHEHLDQTASSGCDSPSESVSTSEIRTRPSHFASPADAIPEEKVDNAEPPHQIRKPAPNLVPYFVEVLPPPPMPDHETRASSAPPGIAPSQSLKSRYGHTASMAMASSGCDTPSESAMTPEYSLHRPSQSAEPAAAIAEEQVADVFSAPPPIPERQRSDAPPPPDPPIPSCETWEDYLAGVHNMCSQIPLFAYIEQQVPWVASSSPTRPHDMEYALVEQLRRWVVSAMETLERKDKEISRLKRELDAHKEESAHLTQRTFNMEEDKRRQDRMLQALEEAVAEMRSMKQNANAERI